MTYYFRYAGTDKHWYFSDRLSQLRGGFKTRGEAKMALDEYSDRLELEGWGC